MSSSFTIYQEVQIPESGDSANSRVWISDLNGDGHMDCEEEILQIKDYYPFGMPHDLAETADLPSLPYRDSDPFTYNDKEYEDRVTKMYDYHARWYDAALGRWGVVDPMAEQMPGMSPYNYVFNNPIRFIDPDGRSPDDIILGTNNRAQLLAALQSLTNDKLDLVPETGEVFVVRTNSSNFRKDLSSGTNLVKSLINDDNTTTITKTIVGNGTNPIDENGNMISGDDVQLGVEYDSDVGVDLTPSNTVNADGTRGGVPAFITLAHELGHAESNAKGTNDRRTFQAYDYDTEQLRSVTVEEFRSRVKENNIRSEQGLKLRALPVPIFLKF